MALTTQPQPAKYARSLSGASAPILHGVEKASQTYTKGAFVTDDDAGRITESTSVLSSTAANRTIGIALRSATGVTGADVPFVFLTEDTVIEITLTDLSAGTHTLAQADYGKVFAPTKGTANWYLDANAVGVNVGGGVVIGFKDPIGTVDARVYCIMSHPVRGFVDAGSLAI